MQEHTTHPKLQWQTHPIEYGLLCYILVDLSADSKDRIRAIYHHIGLGLLSISYSEGVLLLPGDDESRGLEGAVVASVLSLLRQLSMFGNEDKLKRSHSNGFLRKLAMNMNRYIA